MEKTSKIYVACHTTLAGSAILETLKARGFSNCITRSPAELDLTSQSAVAEFFAEVKPEYIFLPSAKSGSIKANMARPAEFLYENLQSQTNIIHQAYLNKVKKLLYIAASCVYPKNCPQPIKEEYLGTGPLEETNEAYAEAKIAGLRMVESYNAQYQTNFIAAVPATLYGRGDEFDLENSHVLAALIKKMHEAKKSNADSVSLWGTGNPEREFISTDDFADVCLFLMENLNPTKEDQKGFYVNVGTGQGISIKELAKKIKNVTGYEGKISWDTSKPDGALKKVLDSSRLADLGWKSQKSLNDGLFELYNWYKLNLNDTAAISKK